METDRDWLSPGEHTVMTKLLPFFPKWETLALWHSEEGR